MFNGVAYQLAWTLFSAVRLCAKVGRAAQPGHPGTASLTVEPLAGGDLELLEGSDRIRVEIKARPGGTWRLSEIIAHVLPRLFTSHDSQDATDRFAYQFITDGTLGIWKEDVYLAFFRSLRARPTDLSDVCSSLDDTRTLRSLVRYPGLAGRIRGAGYNLTERGLFSHIADTIGRGHADSAGHARLYCQLAAFEILEGRTADNIYPQIRRELSCRGIPDEDLEAKLQELCFALLQLAAKGPEWMEPSSFLLEHGIGALSLSHWSEIVRRSQHLLSQTQAPRGYDHRIDCRAISPLRQLQQTTRDAKEGLSPQVTSGSGEGIVVLLGASGQGKSWALDRAAGELSGSGEVVVVLNTSGDPAEDRRRAGQVFCEQIWDHDHSFSLERLAEKVARVREGATYQPWLTLFIDGVQDADYVQRLVRGQWSSLGIRPVLGVTTQEEGDRPSWLPSGCVSIRLLDFTIAELIRFLRTNLAPGVAFPPVDVCDLIRRPFLARLYVDSVGSSGGWVPSVEYELIEQYWRDRTQNCGLAAAALTDLAADLFDRWVYPWPNSMLRSKGLGDSDLDRLRAAGLLAPSDQGRAVRVWHERLLQWMVAEGLAARLDTGELDQAAFLERALAGATGEQPLGSRFGYVPMDALWIVADPRGRHPGVAVAVLQGLEAERTNFSLLSSLGSRMVPHIFARLRQLAGPIRCRTIRYLEVLESIGGAEVALGAVALLREGDPSLQRMAIRLLKAHGTAEALDRLWELYQQWSDDTDVRGAAGDRSNRGELVTVRLSDTADAEEALRSCVPAQAHWLELAISKAGSRHIHVLLYLLSELEAAGDVWQRVKAHAIATVESRRERSIALCIERFCDREELGWLEQRLDHPEEFVAPFVKRAAYSLAPEMVLRHVGEETWEAERLFRRLWLPWLQLERLKDATHVISETRRQFGDPWKAAAFFDGRESWLPAELLELLLDDTERTVGQELEHPRTDGRDPLYRRFRFLERVSRPTLLERFWHRAGRPLERDLAVWLVSQGACDDRGSRLTVQAGRAVLCKIAGKEIARVANADLQRATTRWGRAPGVHLALRRSDDGTVELLEGIARNPELDTIGVSQPFPLSQRHALEALAVLGADEALIPGIIQWGTKLSREFPEYLDGRKLADGAIACARASLEAPEGPSPGEIIALGLSGHADVSPRILGILRRVEPDSELSIACILALEYLGDGSEETVDALAKALKLPETHYVAWRALFSGSRSPRAFQTLLAYLEGAPSETGGDLALNLLVNPETRTETARMLWRTVDPETFRFQFGDYLEYFAGLGDTGTQDLFMEEAFASRSSRWFRSSPRSAIRGLGQREPNEAFHAAEIQLSTGPRDERPSYPPLLLELDPERALRLFAESVRKSEDIIVLRAIGEALDDSGQEAMLRSWLSSPDPRLREGACFASTPFRWSPGLDTCLLERLRDPSWRVRPAASHALEALRQEREVRRLIDMLEAEADRARRWAIVDAAVDLGDPGVSPRCGAENWVARLCDGLPFAIKKHVFDRLKSRREELWKRLEKERRS